MKRKSDRSTAQTETAVPVKRITLAQNVSVEMEERKSVFIGHACPITSEEDARRFIDEKRREYHDATHNVYAYLLSGGALARYSDDGEPQGTAGMPVLNVVKMSGATDLCVVVTRYFGGILLGAGGLVRAYTAAAKIAVDAAGLAVYEEYGIYEIVVSYSDYQKLTFALAKIDATEDHCDFGENVTVVCAIKAEQAEELIKTVSELTFGKGRISLIRTEERASIK